MNAIITKSDLTTLELELITEGMLQNEMRDGRIIEELSLWNDVLETTNVKGKQIAGVVSSLVKKGILGTTGKAVWFTPAGEVIAAELDAELKAAEAEQERKSADAQRLVLRNVVEQPNGLDRLQMNEAELKIAIYRLTRKGFISQVSDDPSAPRYAETAEGNAQYLKDLEAELAAVFSPQPIPGDVPELTLSPGAAVELNRIADKIADKITGHREAQRMADDLAVDHPDLPELTRLEADLLINIVENDNAASFPGMPREEFRLVRTGLFQKELIVHSSDEDPRDRVYMPTALGMRAYQAAKDAEAARGDVQAELSTLTEIELWILVDAIERPNKPNALTYTPEETGAAIMALSLAGLIEPATLEDKTDREYRATPLGQAVYGASLEDPGDREYREPAKRFNDRGEEIPPKAAPLRSHSVGLDEADLAVADLNVRMWYEIEKARPDFVEWPAVIEMNGSLSVMMMFVGLKYHADLGGWLLYDPKLDRIISRQLFTTIEAAAVAMITLEVDRTARRLMSTTLNEFESRYSAAFDEIAASSWAGVIDGPKSVFFIPLSSRLDPAIAKGRMMLQGEGEEIARLPDNPARMNDLDTLESFGLLTYTSIEGGFLIRLTQVGEMIAVLRGKTN